MAGRVRAFHSDGNGCDSPRQLNLCRVCVPRFFAPIALEHEWSECDFKTKSVQPLTLNLFSVPKIRCFPVANDRKFSWYLEICTATFKSFRFVASLFILYIFVGLRVKKTGKFFSLLLTSKIKDSTCFNNTF